MKVTVWGTRGSVPTPRPSTSGYGGNTSCVSIEAEPQHLVVLDAGTGICSLGAGLDPDLERIDILLTHLHMDHIIGLGFFDGLFREGLEVHIWGPASPTLDLAQSLNRYLSPPLFPVLLRDLPCDLHLHDVPREEIGIPGLEVTAARVCHPGITMGYRLDDGVGAVCYLPDHEPALCAADFPGDPSWTSGFDLAAGVDLLFHDAQFTADEYARKLGWGHSSFDHAIAFGRLCEVEVLALFHHDPDHSDADLDVMHRTAIDLTPAGMHITSAREGQTFTIGR